MRPALRWPAQFPSCRQRGLLPRPKSAPAKLRLTAGTRTLAVNGKSARVFGLIGPNGKPGITLSPGERFRVDLVNQAGTSTIVHWHGQLPPWTQDGFPWPQTPPIAAGDTQSYDYAPIAGTYWMHSHQGMQEQSLMTAPLIVRSGSARRPAGGGVDATRLQLPNARRVARRTEDLVGYLLQEGGFDVLNLPAIALKPATYFTGPNTTYLRGSQEILHPEHEPAEVLVDLRRKMGSMQFSAQYQQTPVPAEGTFIKRKWLKTYSASEISFQPRDRMVISWDIALSEAQTGDSSAGVVLLNRGDKFYVLEVAKGQFLFPQLISKILDMSRRYLGSTLLIEESPISLGLIQELRENNINVVTVRPTKDKHARVISQSGLIEGGSVLFPQRAAWLDAFISELLSFPGGRHDDQVDALVQGLAYQR